MASSNVVFDELDLDNSVAVGEFLTLFKEYNQELGAVDKAGVDLDKWSASILRRLREPDRWLLMARDSDGRAIGFSLFKIDHDEGQGLGYIMEFFVAPAFRQQALGRRLMQWSCCRLGARRVRQVWLTSDPNAEGFWAKCGFRPNGEQERDQKVMIKLLEVRSALPAVQHETGDGS